jgi:hypothetical protein
LEAISSGFLANRQRPAKTLPNMLAIYAGFSIFRHQRP